MRIGKLAIYDATADKYWTGGSEEELPTKRQSQEKLARARIRERDQDATGQQGQRKYGRWSYLLRHTTEQLGVGATKPPEQIWHKERGAPANRIMP